MKLVIDSEIGLKVTESDCRRTDYGKHKNRSIWHRASLFDSYALPFYF
ncbi:hypothetical protein MMG00_06800 [Ignatzschineria rhizosphaerae]|uniref:Uncharacterized protein n=1 Tax=Ignatzschineria rhizosphaerae TaxID=2923279 RepID=A0ABY3WZJ6_9GAMM|nr:hypothetical protein [Ignatzschineria rhizosphaerae]UNM94956.1 hypothetical protein MMG00_06800 [Ignatzschineria rhizosphaerae]